MKPIVILFWIFCGLGLLLALIGHAAKNASPAPSMVTNDLSPTGYTISVICALIALTLQASL